MESTKEQKTAAQVRLELLQLWSKLENGQIDGKAGK